MPARYVALLRAVNVGRRTVTMERLRTLFAELGFGDARTYIQTGNVLFSARSSDRSKLARAIESHLSAALGWDVPVFIRTVDELEAITRSTVFANRRRHDNERYCVIFTSGPAPADFIGSKTAREDFDVLRVTPGELFVVWRLIKGRPGNPGASIEKALGIRTTTRFFHTLEKMHAAAIAAAAADRAQRARRRGDDRDAARGGV